MAKNAKKVRIFSALEVANLCGVVNQTAINWIRNGYLKAFTTPGGQYRIYAEDLMAFLDSRGMRVPPELEERFKDDVDWSSILVVDDDAELNDLLKRWFERKLGSYTIHQAYDGFEAGRLLAEKRPGFVVLDIDLPGVNGHALCRKIKEDPVFGKPFIIAMTGLDRPEESQAILAEGADAFFAKPLDFDSVAASVSELAGKAKARDVE
ncbi:MAG TPA: response regulator [Rectinemataceae bacterium]|nr:response regulator [Rectinemataceae bacterium]